MATAAQVEEFRVANQTLVNLAGRELTEFFQSLDVMGDPFAMRDALLDFFPDLVTVYGDTAAVLAADYYDMLRDVPVSASSFRAAVAQPASTDQARGTVRWAVESLFDPEPDGAGVLALLGTAAGRLVMQPARDTVFGSAWSDPVATGVARVPRGLNTCTFCKMLASRGPVYRSEVSANMVVGRGSLRTGYDANGKRLPGGIGGGIKPRGIGPSARDIGETFHDHCDCAVLVIRSEADYPEGYDPDEYYRAWQEESRGGVSHSA